MVCTANNRTSPDASAYSTSGTTPWPLGTTCRVRPAASALLPWHPLCPPACPAVEVAATSSGHLDYADLTSRAGQHRGRPAIVVATIGTTQTRLEGDRTQMEARYTELEKLTSSETDADMSTTIVKLTQTQTAYQAALQVGAQVLRVSLLDYLR